MEKNIEEIINVSDYLYKINLLLEKPEMLVLDLNVKMVM